MQLLPIIIYYTPLEYHTAVIRRRFLVQILVTYDKGNIWFTGDSMLK